MAIYVTRGPASAATGTGTAVTTEQTFTVPSNAVELVAARGHVHATQGDAAESIFGVFKIVGQDWKYNPYEFFSELAGSKLALVDQVGYEKEPRWWPAHLPVKPGGTIAVTYEPLDAIANNGQFQVDFKWSTLPTGGLPVMRLASRETATTTTTGPTLTITGALRLVEYTIGVTTSTVAADDPSNGMITVTSGALGEQQQLSLTYNIHTIEATSGVALTTLMHAEIDIPFINDPGVFDSRLTETTALGTAGQYAYSLGYVPRSV